VRNLPGSEHWLCVGLSEAMVRFAARYEYAIKVEDVLARRSRLLFLDARLAGRLAGTVADILREETGQDPFQEEFERLWPHYLLGIKEKV
jgi:glycerol-3-phosphate dehydrogenase